MMENLFLRVLAVSAAVSILLLLLLLCRGWLEKTYAPQTRWALWLGVALVLLIAPWLPKPVALVVKAPAYTLTLPVVRPVSVEKTPFPPMLKGADPTGNGTLVHKPPQAVEEIVPGESGIKIGEDTPVVPALSVSPAVRHSFSLTALAGWVWLLGLVLILLGQVGRYLLVRRRLLRSAQPVSGLEKYASELGLAGKVRFYHCEGISGPMTLGIIRPAVLLPQSGLAVAALRHELYHVKRCDIAYKVLVLCACAMHWFDPLVWGLYRWADRDVEACCDAAVVAGQDDGYKRSYGELLLSAAEEPRTLPLTTSFGGGKKQMKARLTQLFQPGRRSRALVCAVLALSVFLGSLVACRQEGSGELADGVYCSPYANVVYPVGEAEAEGEDYGVIRLSLLNYDEVSGPHGKPLGEYTQPLSDNLMLRQLWWGEDRSAGEKGTQEWRRAIDGLVHMPLYRNSIPLGTDYLVVTVKNGEITRLSWALVDRDDTPGGDALFQREEALTENTMPTLVYYDPVREFLLYRTVDTAYFYYGDALEEYHAPQSAGRRVLWRCDVSEDEKTVYLSHVYDDSEKRDERFYVWDIADRTLTEADAIPAGVGHMYHVEQEKLFYPGFRNGTSLKSNVIQAKDGTLVGLYVDQLIGNTMGYLQLSRMGPDGSYEGGESFLTPERIPAPETYREPDWGFTLDLPEGLAGNYVVSKAANNWNFYDKELYSSGGYLFSVWAEDHDTQLATIKNYPGQWTGKILGEKDGITYVATFWEEEMLTPTERENEEYVARMEAVKNLEAGDLDLSAVTRSSGCLWPLPYTEYGSDVILGEEGNTLRILSSEEVTVQCVAGGRVEAVTAHPITGEQTVYLRHPDGRYSLYSHLEYIQLEKGDEVKRGGIIGIAREEDGQRWLSFALMEGASWDTAHAVDPWSVDYRTYDFRPIDRTHVTVAGVEQSVPAGE